MSSTVKALFDTATDHLPKAQRRIAFQELRRLSIYGSPDEAAEAKLALERSALYEQFGGDVAAVLRALESEKEPSWENKVERLRKIISALLASGLTQRRADEETNKLAKLILELSPAGDTKTTN